MASSDISADTFARARKVKLLLMDCDGVLTDGRLYFSERGEELKVFHTRDGQGIVAWHEAGFRAGIISGRDSTMVELRAKQLSMEFICQGRKDKIAAFREILEAANVAPDEAAFIGDDIPDAEVSLWQDSLLPLRTHTGQPWKPRIMLRRHTADSVRSAK